MADAIVVEGWREIVRRMNRLPKVAQAELREQARAIAAGEAARIQRAGASDDLQSQAVATFIRARSDRVPSIVATSSRKAGVSGGATVRQLFYGAEFGGDRRPTTQQFRPWRGREGHWFWPTLRADQDRMVERWETALRAIEREWTREG